MSQSNGLTVADIGEFALIERMRQWLERTGVGVIRGIGDDTAVLCPAPGRVILATTDTAVEGVHFSRLTTTPELLGQRVLAVNLSDIASMGGDPRWALLSLSLPGSTSVDFVERLVEGVGLEAIRYGVVVVGGNLARSPDRLIVDVTMLGEADPGQVLYRRGARAGDRILVTGSLGDSAAGLALLQEGRNAVDVDAQFLIARHHVPTPRIEAGRAIARSGLASAMIDLSDGLASDLAHLAGASGVGAVVAASAVPLSPELRRLAGSTGRDPLDWALRGGEDYELLLTAAPVSVRSLVELVAAEGARLTDIGEVTASRELRLLRPDGTSMELGNGSWHHWSR